jgi:acetamidase/formamidase
MHDVAHGAIRSAASCAQQTGHHHAALQIYFPVFVEGANLSMGDMHFSQGDGEVSFCGAIEMSGFLELK